MRSYPCSVPSNCFEGSDFPVSGTIRKLKIDSIFFQRVKIGVMVAKQAFLRVELGDATHSVDLEYSGAVVDAGQVIFHVHGDIVFAVVPPASD